MSDDINSVISQGAEEQPPDIRVYDNQQRAAQLVRSWRDNFIKEAGGPDGIPPLLLVGGKVLVATDILTNIATAIERLPRIASAHFIETQE